VLFNSGIEKKFIIKPGENEKIEEVISSFRATIRDGFFAGKKDISFTDINGNNIDIDLKQVSCTSITKCEG
jgi:hypothetical protein